MRPKLIYVSGDSYNNTGDIAMVEAFVQELVGLVPEIEVVFLAHDPGRFAAAFPKLLKEGHRVIPSGSLVMTQQEGIGRLAHIGKSILNKRPIRPSFSKALPLCTSPGSVQPTALDAFKKEITSSQAFVIGGGGGLNDVFHFVRPTFLAAATAQAAGIPVFAVGQSIGPFHLDGSKKIMKTLIEFSEKFELREKTGSMVWVEKVGVKPEDVSVGADSAMLIPVGASEKAQEKLKELFGCVPEKLVTLNPRFLPESNKEVTLEKHIENFTKLIEGLIIKENVHVLSIPSLYKSSSAQEEKPHMDRPVSHKIKAGLSDPSRMAVLDNQIPVEEVKALHGQARLSIGVGYHPCLFALTAGTPCLILAPDQYYAVKNTGLADLLGVPELLVNAEKPTWPEQALKKALETMARTDEYRPRLLARAEELTQTAKSTVGEIAACLKQPVH